MARKTKPKPSPEPGFRLTEHPVKGARPLITIGPEHPVWQGIPIGCDEAIVRIQPPEGATDEEIAKVVERATGTGAVMVRVDRRRVSRVVLEPREARPHTRARDVVLEIARASNVEDVPKLIEFCEQVMGKALL